MSLKSKSLGTVGSAAAGILITGGTNATPIVATVTAGHRLKNGDRLSIAGVTGLTSMNGDWTIGSVGATSATLLGSAGNGTFGGTAAVAVICDQTPHMYGHSAVLVIGNTPGAAVLVGTVVIEGADSVDATQHYYTNSSGVATAGFTSALMSGEIAIPAVTAGIGLTLEVKMYRYMRFRASAWTSGNGNAQLLA